MEKQFDVTSAADLKAKDPRVVIVGNGDLWQLLCKASKEGEWMKSCKAMEVPGGCVVQVTTQQNSNVAEALVFVPGVKIGPDENGGRKLIAID